MGSCSSSGKGVGRFGGGGGNINIVSTTSLISAREEQPQLVDQTLGTFKDFHDQYGTVIGDIELATIGGNGASTMAYYDGENIAVNKSYFNKGIEDAYRASVESGFHPSNGNKTALQAVVAHEIGHQLTDAVGAKIGLSSLDASANRIVNEARKNTSHRGVVQMASKISTYATHSNAEAIAEAVADVYCNGRKAKSESHAIVNVMNKYLKG